MKRALDLRIASLQYAFVRKVNDMHIFLAQACPLLEGAKESYRVSGRKKDRRYYVPALKRTKFARRKDIELIEIYDRFLTHSLYETFLVMAVSQFEFFLADILSEVIIDYPRKLGISSPGIPACRQVSVEVILQAAELNAALESVIDQHLSSVFRASPREYLGYVEAIVGAEFPVDARDRYLELKATRDLLVHGSGIVNFVYLMKAGRMARGTVGEIVTVDRDYFDASLATMKRLSGFVKGVSERSFPRGVKPIESAK